MIIMDIPFILSSLYPVSAGPHTAANLCGRHNLEPVVIPRPVDMYKSQYPAAATAAAAARPKCRAAIVLAAAIVLLQTAAADPIIAYDGRQYGACVSAGQGSPPLCDVGVGAGVAAILRPAPQLHTTLPDDDTDVYTVSTNFSTLQQSLAQSTFWWQNASKAEVSVLQRQRSGEDCQHCGIECVPASRATYVHIHSRSCPGAAAPSHLAWPPGY